MRRPEEGSSGGVRRPGHAAGAGRRRRKRLRLDPPGEVQAAGRPGRRQRRPRRRRDPRGGRRARPPCSTSTAGRCAGPATASRERAPTATAPTAPTWSSRCRTGPWSRPPTARCSPTWSAPAPGSSPPQGGRGGLGNAALASPRRKAPGFALKGEPGERATSSLELKTVADVGLVGFPNAGKSSLIAAMSAARPKIADYPFTTLIPNLGVVEAGDVQFVDSRRAGPDPGREPGQGPGPRLPAARGALLRAGARARLRRPRSRAATRSPTWTRSRRNWPPTATPPAPTWRTGPALVALNKIDVPAARKWPTWSSRSLEARG